MNDSRSTAVDRILAQISDELNDARGVPLKKELCIVDREHLLDLIENAIDNLPGDIAQARKLVQTKERILSDANASADQTINNAKTRADKILADAREMAANLVEENAITVSAKKRAKEIYESNETKVNDLKREAINYVGEKLDKAAATLENLMAEVSSVRKDVRSTDISGKKEN